eukprot:6752761-Pyramimonas_sp.AAC.1
MSKKYTNKSQVLKNADDNSTSHTTFEGLLSFLANHRPATWLGENVDEMDKVTSENRCHMIDKLGEIGYVVDTQVVHSSVHVAATARRRTWIIALQCNVLGLEVDEARSILKDMIKYIPSLQVKQLPLKDFLLNDKDKYVSEAFENAVKVHAQSSAESPASEAKWKNDLTDLLRKKHMSWRKCRAPKAVAEGRWFSTLPARDRM